MNAWEVELENRKLSNLDLETQQTLEKNYGIGQSSLQISSNCQTTTKISIIYNGNSDTRFICMNSDIGHCPVRFL